MPKGHFFAEIEITDPEICRHYMPLAEAAVAACGGALHCARRRHARARGHSFRSPRRNFRI